MAVALDEEGARVSGLPIGLLNVALAALAGVTIAVSMRIVGILLIAALMVLPVITAGRIGTSIRSTIGRSMAIGLLSVAVGLTISYLREPRARRGHRARRRRVRGGRCGRRAAC